MSSFSVTAIDRLIEPAQGGILPRSASMERERHSAGDNKPLFSFYPPLYATPPPQRPPSPSPSSFSPSPYVLNHKRRGPPSNGVKNVVLYTTPATSSLPTVLQSSSTVSKSPPRPDDNLNVNLENAVYAQDLQAGEDRECGHGEIEVFDIEMCPSELPIREGDIQISTSLGNLRHFKEASLSYSTLAVTGEEFYDAPDAPLDDSASEDEASLSDSRNSSLNSNELAVRLHNEVVRRMKAEQALDLFQKRWNQMAKRCASVGFFMSQPSEYGSIGTIQVTNHPFDVLIDKLLVARMVSGAIARAAMQAEKDEEMERVIAAKNREISRLWDKLQYYELINREMSQRNQEAVESNQRRKRRRQRQQKWVLRGFSAAVCVGTTSLLCYKVFPWEQVKRWLKSFSETLPSVEPSID